MILDQGFAPVGDVKLFYKTGGKGPPVVVLHGGPGMDHHTFLPQFERLADNARLVLYDQRACGKSSGFAYEATTRLSVYVKDLDLLRRFLKLKTISLIGFSFGGLLAMRYAIDHPEFVSNLILLNSVPARDDDGAGFSPTLRSRTPPHEQAELDRLRQSAELAQGSGAVLNQWLRLRFRAYFFDESKLSTLKVNFTDETARNYVRVADLLGQDVDGYDYLAELARVQCPTLILQGDYDPISPSFMVATQKALTKSRLEIIRDAGHFSYVEQPEAVFARLAAFLQNNE